MSWSRPPTTPGRHGAPTPKSKQKQQQQNFSFPLLPVKDILTCLAELYFTISEDELVHCDKHVPTVRRLFEYLLEVLAGTRKDEINMPVFAAHQNLAWPQLHEDSIPEIAFWRAMSKLMDVCGVTDFTREDLIKPEPKRLRKQLSGLINFAKFREERMELYQRITVERDELLDRLQNGDDSNAHLQKTLDELRLETKSQREEIRILDEATAQAAAKVNGKNETQSMLRDQAAELKKANNELKEKLGEAGLDHGKLLAEVKKLQSQVVQSPERVRREMHESQRALQQERREGEAAEAAALVATNAAKIAVEGHAKVVEAAEVVGGIMELSNKCVEVSHQVKAREAAIARNRKDAGEVAESCVDVERTNARLEEKLATLEATGEAKALVAAEQNEHLRAKLLEQKRKKATSQAVQSEEERACEQLERALVEQEQQQRLKMEQLVGAWRRLDLSVRQHQASLLNGTLGCQQQQQQQQLTQPPLPPPYFSMTSTMPAGMMSSVPQMGAHTGDMRMYDAYANGSMPMPPTPANNAQYVMPMMAPHTAGHPMMTPHHYNGSAPQPFATTGIHSASFDSRNDTSDVSAC